ncbi:ABC transporter substrate-binding protein [Mycobacterium sp. URHB0021]
MKFARTLRKVIIVCAAVGLVSAAAACTPMPAGGGAAAADSALRHVLATGTLRVASCLSFTPFGFTNPQGQPDGYDVDIAKELAKDMGVKLEVVDTTSSNRIPNLQTSKVDVVFCNFTRTMERAKEIAFTDPYVVATEGLLVRSGSGVTSLESMKGRTIAVVKGSTNADVLRERGIDVKVAEFDSSQAAVLAVKQGQADAMVEDSNYLQYQAKLNPGLQVVTSNLVPLEYNAFGVKQGDQVWVDYLNQFLFDLSSSGKNLELYRKWFGVDPRFPLRPTF